MRYFAAALIFAFSLSPAFAAEFQVPRLTGPVVDNARKLSPSFRRSLTQSLYKLKQATAADPIELAVLTVPEMNGLTIEQASIKVVDKWKLGGAKGDRGLLLMLAKKEQRVRIEVGQGLEGLVTDAYSSQVIDHMLPLFKAGRIEEGVLIGVASIAQKATPNMDAAKIFGSSSEKRWKRKSKSRGGLALLPIIIFALFFIFGGRGTRGALLTGMLLGSMGGRRGGGGGFSGGGFGGGGGFSGGGASGGW